MIKLALITDTHWGIRNDYQPLLENNRAFFSEVFFPKLKQENIKVIFHLGDLVDRRKYVNYNTAYRLKKDFLDPAIEGGYHLHWILGNHDIYYRDTAEVNAADILTGLANPAIHKYSQATEVSFGDTGILLIPWITNENREYTLQKISNSKSQILFGHLAIQGAKLDSGMSNREGETADVFSKFDVVLTGHFHHKSAVNNILYIGSHSQFIWSDYGEERGFYIFDTETRDMEFIENPFSLFAKVYYDDAKGKAIIPQGGFEQLQNKLVKVIVSGKTDPNQYDWFMDQIEAAQPLDINVIDDHLNLHLTDDESIVSESKDTLQIIREYIKQANNIVNIDKLDQLVVDLYQKAQIAE